MQFFQNMLKFLGVLNRHLELRISMVAFWAILIKLALVEEINTFLFVGFLFSLMMVFAEWVIEERKRRGLSRQLEIHGNDLNTLFKLADNMSANFENTLNEVEAKLGGKLEALEKDHNEVKRIVALLNNKQVLTSFQQGLVNKQRGQTPG